MNEKENCMTLANKVHTKKVQSLKEVSQNANNISEFKQSLLDFNYKRKQTQNNYEKVIVSLENFVQELLQKIDFYTQDRLVLIQENNELRKKVESLTNILEVKRRLGQSCVVENSQIFQIIVETASVTRGMSKIEESYEIGNTIGNIIEENQQIFDRQQFVITNNPLSHTISQIEEGENSMSNIGRTQTFNHMNIETPGLHRQNLFIQCPATKTEGVIRAFYLSVIQKHSTTSHLIQVIQSLRNDNTTIIYEAYPTNQFWTNILIDFLKYVRQQRFDNQMDVLQHLKTHKLLDSLIIKCLKTRIQFLFNNMDSFQMPSVHEILVALSNQFGLRMQTYEGQYVFYTKQAKDQSLFLNDKASLQISLNIKEDNKLYIKEEEPCFVIHQRNETLQFSFCILIETMLGISEYQLNDGSQNQQSIRCSKEMEYSLNLRLNQMEQVISQDDLYAAGGILSEKDTNNVKQEKRQLNRKFGHARERYVENKSPQIRGPLSSSRYFLNRVASKNSSFDENA